eukprot:scaffold2312_cov165-Ochromonas_danica.AAC.55
MLAISVWKSLIIVLLSVWCPLLAIGRSSSFNSPPLRPAQLASRNLFRSFQILASTYTAISLSQRVSSASAADIIISSSSLSPLQGLYSDPDNHFALIVPDQWTVLARKNPPPNFGRYRAEDILLTAVNVAEGASLGVTRSDAHDLLRDLDIDWWFAPFNTLSDVGSPELIANWLIIQRQGEFEARRTSSEVVKATFSSSSTTTPQGRAFLDFEFITPLVKGSKRRTLARAFLQGDSLVVVWLSTLNDKVKDQLQQQLEGIRNSFLLT